MSNAGSREVPPDETHTVRIWCPDCGWEKTIEMDGPAHEDHAPELSQAMYFAENDARRHVAEVATPLPPFEDEDSGEEHQPFLFTDSGVRRYEPTLDESGRFVE